MIGLLDDDSTSEAPRALVDQPGPKGLVVVDWAAASTQGRKRARNEDTWSQLGSVFLVADGMGGLDAGDRAAREAAKSALSRWLDGSEPSPEQVVRAANEAVRAMMHTNQVDSGCTLSALRIAQDQATVAHVGDSRIYRIRGGQADVLTRDHNLRSELLAAGIVPEAAPQFGPLRALTSHLGMETHQLQIDVRSIGLNDGDRLVVCTDGVFHPLAHSEFVRSASMGTARNAVSMLASGASHDDATAIVIDIGQVATR